jgi:hypothetical protein
MVHTIYCNALLVCKSMWTAASRMGRLSIICWNIAAGTCFHLATTALVRSGAGVGQLGLAHSRPNSSQRCLMELRSGLCAGQSSSSTPISTNHFCMDLALCTRVLSCRSRKGPSSNCSHKVGSTELLEAQLLTDNFYMLGTSAPGGPVL